MYVHDTSIFLAYEKGDIDFMRVISLDDVALKRHLLRRASTFLSTVNSFQVRQIRKFEVAPTTHAIVRYDLPKIHESEDPLLAITMSPNSGYLASADSTGLIKIWTNQKQLIREI